MNLEACKLESLCSEFLSTYRQIYEVVAISLETFFQEKEKLWRAYFCVKFSKQ